MNVEITQECEGCSDCGVEVGSWVAWCEETLLFGEGPTPEAASSDLVDQSRHVYDQLVELGSDRISKHLAATIPALQAFLAEVTTG